MRTVKQKKATTYQREPIGSHIFFIVFCVLCLLPMLLVVSISFSTEKDILSEGFRLIPTTFTLQAYQLIFENPKRILDAYKVTTIVTVVATIISVLFMSMMAYVLSRKSFKYRRFFSFYLFFTMLFSGGLVPYYILMTKYLKLTDTILALIVPHLFLVYYTFIIRTNFQSLSESMVESAKIDGASEFRIYWQIVMPLSTPTLATIGLFMALNAWNDWFTSLLFINKSHLYSLQMLLHMMMNNIQAMQNDMDSMLAQSLLESRDMPGESLRMAMAIVAVGPIALLFPFLQKYFVRGLTVGSVKG